MPDFEHVDRPYFSPTACFLCGANQCPDGFADTLISRDLVGMVEARVYVCGICVKSFASLFGYVAPVDAQALRELIADRDRRVAELEEALAVAEDTKVVSLKDLRKLSEGAPAKRQRARAS